MNIKSYINKLKIADKTTKGCVYCAYNKKNNKIYIGYTQNTLFKRISSHYYSSNNNIYNNFFHSSLFKYGKDNFNWYILYQSKNIIDLKTQETFFINLFNSNNKKYGYNLSTGGESPKLNNSSRMKISKKTKKRNLTGERNPFFGKKHSTETKKHLSKIRIGVLVGNKNPFFGKKHSLVMRKKLSKIRKDLCKNEKVILNLRNAQKSKPILCINNGIEYRSINEAARQLSIHKSGIKDQLHKRLKTYKGLKFKFV
jgi:group I intron endonuclease